MSDISVIMPVYNTKEEYFREAIQSILSQTFKNFEFIIVDDCSEPYIAEIVRSYSDDRIKYFKLQQNSGAAEARNFALKQVQTPYVAFLDSDDVAYPERLEKQYNYLKNHQEIGCLGTKVDVIGSSGLSVSFPMPTQHKDIELWILLNGNVLCQSSVMLRKKILDENHIWYNPDYVPAEDYAFWLDLVGLTKFAVLDEYLGEYRIYPENISNKQKERQCQKGNDAKMKALVNYLGVAWDDKSINVLNKFLSEQKLTSTEIKQIDTILPEVIQKLRDKNCSNLDISRLLTNHFRKLLLHTRTFYGHYLLMRSSLNKYFDIPFSRRLFYFISRGIF